MCIRDRNETPEINGILVQLPLPKHIDEKVVIENISPAKDVDAFHPANVGKIMIGDYDFLPVSYTHLDVYKRQLLYL